MENEIYYRYFKKWYANDRNEIVSVGYKIVPDTFWGVNIIYAVAYCGSKDTFSRKKAREVIKGRMNQGLVNTIFYIDPITFPPRTFPELIKLHYNTWVRKFIPIRIGVKQIPEWGKHIN